ncbi:hypothetical protein [Chryseobacterium mucoviscidosis]|uniref:hypothetical protein n=1 Tax=Chryseobacterium mucoviscidosis TaxID=1945581 RepID=UPI00301A88AD
MTNKKKLFLLMAVSVLGFKSFAQVGINTTKPQGVLHVDGKSSSATTNDPDNAPTALQSSDDFVVKSNGSVGIGTVTPDGSAILDMNVDQLSSGSKKGLLIPRMALTSRTDITTIPNPATGLLVYNLGTNSGFSYSGYVYWNGSEWRLMEDTSPVGAVAFLNCNAAALDPSQLIDGNTPTAITSGTVMKIPYSGANGGQYSGITLYSVGNPGVTATITGGKLEVGSGSLAFAVQGTPIASQTSPVGITFDLTPFITANSGLTGCSSVTVGTQVNADVKTVAVMDYMKFVTDPDTGVKGFVVEAKTPDGLYTVKVFMRHSLQNATATASNNTISTASGAENNVLLRNNSSTSKTIMWNYSTFYGGQITDAGGSLVVPSQTPGGGDGNTWRSLSTSNAGAWGNPGIYNAVNSGPEYRYYSWIDTSTTSKVSYTATVMAGMDPSATATEVTKQKVFIKIEQITGQ